MTQTTVLTILIVLLGLRGVIFAGFSLYLWLTGNLSELLVLTNQILRGGLTTSSISEWQSLIATIGLIAWVICILFIGVSIGLWQRRLWAWWGASGLAWINVGLAIALVYSGLSLGALVLGVGDAALLGILRQAEVKQTFHRV
ncbi:hypothetical protein [Pantanalinema sp. GBBB05]|uniref:hypothetical protein n=1 Tax=Pantanalinema sp. GBBB05 TaxID=2604139 RepID=UPI001DDF1E4F|nr:hypothetical protein [Pantanalinema sp. GBBB05]